MGGDGTGVNEVEHRATDSNVILLLFFTNSEPDRWRLNKRLWLQEDTRRDRS